MKTKTLARRIASVVLAMMIVLSFALVSVSALPADLSVVDSKREVINFDDGVTKGGLGASTEATSFTIVPESETDPVHSGTHSLKIVGKSGYARIKYQGITFEPNSTYHVSFWYYSPTWTNNNGGAGANANPGGSTRGTVSHSGYTTNQWNKIWFDITTGASVTSQNFTFCFWGVGDTTSLYIDDFEVAKVGASSASHTVPAGMTAEKTISKSFEELTITSLYGYATSTGFTTMATNSTTPVSAENAHWGEVSLKLQNDGEVTKDYGMYVNIRDNQAFGATGMTLEANANYYFS